MTSQATKISICVCTYKRPRGITALLDSLEQLQINEAETAVAEVIVVDNDPQESARELIENRAMIFFTRLRYVAEPRRGIAHARNTAVAAVDSQSDAVVFVDDDETVTPPWLSSLVQAWKITGVDIVSGPVLANFSKQDPPPAWLTRGNLFRRPQHITHLNTWEVGTGNVLIDHSVLREYDPPFDLRFGLTGGEDTHLFLRMHSHGRTSTWAAEAVAWEDIPPSRTTMKWLLSRSYRGGNTYSHSYLDVFPSTKSKIRQLLSGIKNICFGAVTLLISPVRGQRTGAARGMMTIAAGIGVLGGLFGHRYLEYNTVHGS